MKIQMIFLIWSYERNAISVRTAGVLPIEECRSHKSFKNDPTEWKQLCIEGKSLLEIPIFKFDI